MISLTSIEEIVKYQQELLNHQRNQKQIQKETIKLLNNLNKNITFMSDRLDEFAFKTNLKLKEIDISPSKSYKGNSNGTVSNSNNFNCFNNFFDINLNNNNTITSNLNEPIKEYYILSDCNLEQQQFLQSTSVSKQESQYQQPNQIMLVNQESMSASKTTVKFTNGNNIENNKNVKPNVSEINANVRQRFSKLSDTTNTANKTLTSDEDIDEDISYDQSSDDEKETIQLKKKPKAANSSSSNHSPKAKESEESNNQQRSFNKYVRESVENRLGKEFLLLHEIQEIDPILMEEIKKDALDAYPPINIRPRRAWHLAKASLRCRRRSLRRQKEKQIQSSSSADNTLDLNQTASHSITIQMTN